MCAAFVEYVERGYPVAVTREDGEANTLRVFVEFGDAAAFRRLLNVWDELDREETRFLQAERSGSCS